MKTAIATLIAVVVALAACGGGKHEGEGGVDTSDPVAVAKAFVESGYRCGAEGAGVRARYAYPERAAAEHREAQREEELPDGCHPDPFKPITAALVPSREPGIPAVVEVSNEDCHRTEVPMIEVDGQWFVDESEIDWRLICSPYQG